MTDMTVSETLDQAADLIEERGHATGTGWLHENGGPLCLEGAIMAAAGISWKHPVPGASFYSCPAYLAVREYLRHRTDHSPWRWNDELAHERVMAAIEASTDDLDVTAVRSEAREWAKGEVVATLRAAALIAAASEVDVTVVEARLP